MKKLPGRVMNLTFLLTSEQISLLLSSRTARALNGGEEDEQGLSCYTMLAKYLAVALNDPAAFAVVDDRASRLVEAAR